MDLSLRRNEGRWTWTLNLFVNSISDFFFQEFSDQNGDGIADLVDAEGLPSGEFQRIFYHQTAALEAETGGYVILDLGLRRELAWAGTDSTIYLRGTNLLDETARRHTSFLKDRPPLPGRAAIVGVSLSY